MLGWREGVDVVGSAVAEHQRGVGWVEAHPGAEGSGVADVHQAEDPLDCSIGDADAEDTGVIHIRQVINEATVCGPRGEGDDSLVQDDPVLGSEVEEVDAELIEGRGGDVFSVGRPARGDTPWSQEAW